ncbi:MAG TPA: IclR family transcriptional regulator [bacterium]|nr:IclR family transcriptional regulator [bacterium]
MGVTARRRVRRAPVGGSARAAERTLDILLACLREGPLGISELSRTVRLPKATVHRLVAVLAGRGFLARDPATARYRLGLNAFRLGMAFLAQTHVRDAALPVIHALARETGETVNLNVVIDRQRVCIEKVESTHDIRHAVELGRPMPLYAGASGKVLLAHLPDSDIEAVLASGLERLTDRTVVDPRRLRRHLATIRRQGIAVTSDERVEGASAVSAPVRDASGRVVAGLTISGPTYRFTPERVRRFAALVREGAQTISAALGYAAAVRGEVRGR